MLDLTLPQLMVVSEMVLVHRVDQLEMIIGPLLEGLGGKRKRKRAQVQRSGKARPEHDLGAQLAAAGWAVRDRRPDGKPGDAI